MKYKCNKCGMEVDEIPKQHGFFEQVYNLKGKPVINKECIGKFVLKEEKDGIADFFLEWNKSISKL